MEEVGWSLSNGSPEELLAVRRRVDQIDGTVSALLAERLQLARGLRELKRDLHLPIHDPEREAEVRNRVTSMASDAEMANALQNIYDRIMEQSRLLQSVPAAEPTDKNGDSRPATIYFPRVLIIGLGLIGGALARQMKRCLPKTTVLAVDKPETINRALSQGAIDGASENPLEFLHRVSLIVLSASPEVNLQMLKELAPHLNKGQLVIDVTSTKAAICSLAEKLDLNGADFIGGHPFFGSEKSGFENSESLSLQNKLFCLVPGIKASQISIKRLSRWLSALQMRVEIQDAISHDHISARTSHLVQLLAVALGNCIKQQRSQTELKEILKISGTSLSQIARLMSSPPELWLQITDQNSEPINCSIDELIVQLKSLQTAIADSDRTTLKELFDRAAEVHKALSAIEAG